MDLPADEKAKVVKSIPKEDSAQHTIADYLTPRRMPASSTLEALNPPATIEPIQPATCSRLGPVYRVGEGGFQNSCAGKATSTSSVSSALSPSSHPDIIAYYKNVGGMNGGFPCYYLRQLLRHHRSYRDLVGCTTLSRNIFGNDNEFFSM